MAKILVVDDEESICWGLKKLATSLGHQVTVCSTAEDGFRAAETERPDTIVLDVRLPGMDGLTAMKRFQSITGDTPIVIMTAYGELDSAVAAIRNGAFEYLPKPFDLERVRQVLQRAVELGNASHQTSNSRSDANDSPSGGEKLGDIVGTCAPIQEVFRRIAYAATSDASVLITGESGTGKELAARAIHRYSARSNRPFVAVNVAALSPTLAESELFGHRSGAFTGADRDRDGLLVQADGGTLFLDELAEIPLSLQVKLLRCLDQGEVLPLGSNQPVKTDFRVISATHQDLPTCVAHGDFRHDLFFRICAFQIELPPLRIRGDDIIQLVEFFCRELSTSDESPLLSDALKEELKRRTWAGNVRELRNAIEHALILARGGRILPEHLPQPIRNIQPSATMEGESLENRIQQLVRVWADELVTGHQKKQTEPQFLYDDFLSLLEPTFLKTVMSHFDNQYVAASKALGIHRTTLKKKLADHEDDAPDPASE